LERRLKARRNKARSNKELGLKEVAEELDKEHGE